LNRGWEERKKKAGGILIRREINEILTSAAEMRDGGLKRSMLARRSRASSPAAVNSCLKGVAGQGLKAT